MRHVKRVVWLMLIASGAAAMPTHVQHLIKNSTPYAFYYNIVPATELPMAYSCSCSGIIAAGDTQFCDCYSTLEAAKRRYRIDYMQNISPSYQESISCVAGSEVKIIWQFTYDTYWEWLKVKTLQVPIDT